MTNADGGVERPATRRPYGVSRLRRALVHFISGRAVQAVARALLVLVLVRLLDIGDFGAYMLLVGLSEMLLEVASFGLLPVGQRYLPELITTLPGGKLYRFVSLISFLQIVILCLITACLWQTWPVITPLMGFSAEQTISTRPALWLFLLVPAFRFSADMLEALLEQGKAQIARALMPAGRIAGIGLLLGMGIVLDLPRLIMIDVAVTAFCLLLAWFLLARSLEHLRSSGAAGDIPVREMFRFAWHMAPVGLLGAAASPGALRLALANAIGVAESGLFAFLQSLQRLVGRYLPGTLLRGIVRPILVSRVGQPGGMAVVEAGTRLISKSNLLIVAGGSVIIAICGDWIVTWASGGKFSNAGLTLLLMFLAMAFTAQRAVIEMVMQITGHTATLRATALIAPVALLGVWVFAEFGLNVAILIIAGAAALSNWISTGILIRSTRGFWLDWRGTGGIVLSALLAVGAGLALRGALPIGGATAIAVSIYAVLLWLAKPFHIQELEIVERAVGRRAAAVMRHFSRGPRL